MTKVYAVNRKHWQATTLLAEFESKTDAALWAGSQKGRYQEAILVVVEGEIVLIVESPK